MLGRHCRSSLGALLLQHCVGCLQLVCVRIPTWHCLQARMTTFWKMRVTCPMVTALPLGATNCTMVPVISACTEHEHW